MPVTKGYKVTDPEGKAGKTRWKIGKRVEVRGKGSELCSADVLHYYSSPELASFFNCAHSDIDKPILWEVEVENKVADDGTKCGAKALTPTKRDVPLPVLTALQRVEVAIRCAKVVTPANSPWHTWADNWLSGKDRSREAAAEATWSAASRAAWLASRAAWLAKTTWAEDEDADWAAARAAARVAARKLNITRIIRQVIKEAQDAVE